MWLQESQDATNPKQHKNQVIIQPIRLKKGPRHGEEELLSFLQKQSVVKAMLKAGQAMGSEKESLINEQIESAGEAQVPLTKLWQELVDAERDLHPTVTVIGKPERNGRHWHIPIQEDVRNFELSAEEQVQITNDDPEERWYYGNLDLTNVEDGILVVTEGRYIEGLRSNTKLQLVEARSESSWQRRQKALYRVLKGEALIPELAKHFDSTTVPIEDKLPPLKAPNEQEMQRFNLDDSKQQAMRHVLNKRLNVIMGPPGTGKTTLLANLLEHLHQLPEVNKILLVSQSHVAVNEVAIRAREVISRLARSEGLDPESVEPSMVRLGDRSRLGPELLDIHVEALQSQYRTAFHRDFDARLLALSPRLGLPRDFLLDTASLYRRLGRELHEYNLARKICAELKATREAEISKPHRGKEREYEVAQQQLMRLHDALSRKLREYTDEFESLLESEDPQLSLLEILAQRHQINNPLQVSRLSEVVNIAHHWYQRLSADEDGFAGFAAKTRKLVIGTLVGIGKSSYNLAKNEYDIAIIDEAGRATASELAMAMQSAKRVILVGDHKQLPPLYNKNLITQVASKLGLDEKEVRRTDFERAFLKSQGHMLDTQYRMAKPIGDLVSHVFYEDGLHTGRPPAPDWMKQLPSPWDRTVTWLNTSHSPQLEQNLGKFGVANLAEIDLVCSLLQQLTEDSEAMEHLRAWSHDDRLPPIGIITGYRKQVDALRQRLDSDSWATPIRSLVRIDTIDSYQGSENRIVLLSLVRHNLDKKTGFMDDFPRINVALSRAKERLIVIGAGSMWQRYKMESPLSLVYNYISVKSELSNSEYQVLSPEELLQTKGDKELMYAP
ncbi:AAA domain-containing protein [Salinicola sp. LHM]|uniref:DEAD/DEAH box helicase n=1 Tax=Salinicola sp. LHM TaxID=3065298 RepID=UPI002ACDC2E5|nr:AAA domain-containing protein [Salinicola sp. LHM]WQH33767.1 AAA domain-containing protein [Salinicola sp. LHM]